MSSIAVTLRDDQNKAVQAQLIAGISAAALDDWEASWQPFIQRKIQPGASPRGRWNWRQKVDARLALPTQGFTVACNGSTEGLMIVESAMQRGRLPEQHGQHLIYVEFLESAPWNQKALNDPPRYRGVGSTLLRAAVEYSFEEQFKGRIGLH